LKKDTIILFDLDGTLIDSTDAIVSTFHHSFKVMEYDFKGCDEDIKALIGYPLDIMYKDLGIEDSKVWDFVDAYKNRYKDISTKKTLLLDKAYEAVELAASFARVSVVTTKTRKYTMPLLEHFDINKYFEIVTGRECVQNPKPHPEPILKTLSDMNFDKTKHDVWMIGDTKLDLICAKESSINSVGVLCGYGSQEELLEYTKNIKNDAFDAVRYIKELNI
jgi:phosphoglycolate phosphatase-like HAD superfamily hydrolase